jgi:hypothetical protein
VITTVLADFGKPRITFGGQGDLRLIEMALPVAGQLRRANGHGAVVVLVELFDQATSQIVDRFEIHHGEEVMLSDGYRLRYTHDTQVS